MKQTKYISNGGLAFSEEKDMKKLSKYAKKGWLLDGFGFGGFYYRLRRGEPQDIEYSLDYQNQPDEEYFSLFEAAGWSLVLSDIGTQIFVAPKGTKPIYSDNETVTQKYEKQKKFVGKLAFISFFPTIILFLLLLNSENGILDTVVLILLIPSVVMFVFSVMPYLAYSNRVRKLEKS